MTSLGCMRRSSPSSTRPHGMQRHARLSALLMSERARLRRSFDHESRGVLRGFGINVLRLESSCRDLCGFATHRVIQRLSAVGAHGVAARDKKRQDVQGQFVGGKLNPTFRRDAARPAQAAGWSRFHRGETSTEHIRATAGQPRRRRPLQRRTRPTDLRSEFAPAHSVCAWIARLAWLSGWVSHPQTSLPRGLRSPPWPPRIVDNS